MDCDTTDAVSECFFLIEIECCDCVENALQALLQKTLLEMFKWTDLCPETQT